jgi:hypothetical protein
MDDNKDEFDRKKPTIALFIILLGIVVAALLIEWIFMFFKERM